MKKKLTVKTIETLRPIHGKPQKVYDVELPGFMVRVQPTGYKAYYVEYVPEGKQKQTYRIGPVATLSLAQARDKAKEFLASVTLGNDPAEERRKAKASDLGKFLNECYGPWVTENRKSGSVTLRRLLGVFKPLLRKHLHELTPYEIERWRAAKRKAKGNKSATLNRDVACLKAALSWGARQGYLGSSPLLGIQMLQERDSQDMIRYLSAEEESRLIAALDNREEKLRAKRDRFNTWRQERGYHLLPNLRKCTYADHLKPMVSLSLYTGLRRGELFDLTWADVDIDHAILTVRRAAAKSGRSRHVPLNDAAVECLKAWRSQTKGQELVFQNPKKGGRFGHVNDSWRAVMRAANLKSFRWHDMRHTFASRLVMAGVDLNTVRELLGHADIKMTLRYAHLSPETKRAAVALLQQQPVNIVPFSREETA